MKKQMKINFSENLQQIHREWMETYLQQKMQKRNLERRHDIFTILTMLMVVAYIGLWLTIATQGVNVPNLPFVVVLVILLVLCFKHEKTLKAKYNGVKLAEMPVILALKNAFLNKNRISLLGVNNYSDVCCIAVAADMVRTIEVLISENTNLKDIRVSVDDNPYSNRLMVEMPTEVYSDYLSVGRYKNLQDVRFGLADVVSY